MSTPRGIVTRVTRFPIARFRRALRDFRALTSQGARAEARFRSSFSLSFVLIDLAGSRNAVKLAASGGNPAAAVPGSAHPPVLWSSRRKPGKSSFFLVLIPAAFPVQLPFLFLR